MTWCLSTTYCRNRHAETRSARLARPITTVVPTGGRGREEIPVAGIIPSVRRGVSRNADTHARALPMGGRHERIAAEASSRGMKMPGQWVERDVDAVNTVIQVSPETCPQCPGACCLDTRHKHNAHVSSSCLLLSVAPGAARRSIRQPCHPGRPVSSRRYRCPWFTYVLAHGKARR